MIGKQKIKTKENLQVKFHKYLYNLRSYLTLPEYKFIQDVSLGILKSRSVIVNRIGQKLDEKITLKKTCERLYRNLQKQDLGEKIQHHIIQSQSRGFNDDTIIIVDDSDIIKSKAKKMEGLKKVRDGSTGRCDQSGYDLINIIACKHEETGYQIKPLSSELVSQDIEQDSIEQLTEDKIIDIIIHSNNRGIFTMDRGYDRRKFLKFLGEHEVDFIVRSTGRRNLIVDGQELAFKQVAKSVKLKTIVQSNRSKDTFRCGLKEVQLRLDPHPKKNPKTISLYLIVCRYVPKGKGKAGYFYFFCKFPNQQLLKETIINKVIKSYEMRNKIEEMHRHIKQDYGWEKIQLLSYTALRNMNQLLLLTMCYLYSLKKIAAKLLLAFPNIMKYTNKKWKQIYDFVYYRISILIEYCLIYVTRYKLARYKTIYNDDHQLVLSFIKNGGM